MYRRFHDRFGTALAKGLFTKAQEKKIAQIAKKYVGENGAPGANGTNGTNGAKGDLGFQGIQGNPGANGKTVLHGTGAPTTQGTEGDFYINTTTDEICGPKGASSWPTPCTTLKGTNGTTGFTETLPPGETETGTWVMGPGPDAGPGLTRSFPSRSHCPQSSLKETSTTSTTQTKKFRTRDHQCPRQSATAARPHPHPIRATSASTTGSIPGPRLRLETAPSRRLGKTEQAPPPRGHGWKPSSPDLKQKRTAPGQ